MAIGSMYSDLNVIEGNVKHSQMTKEDLIAELNALIFKEYGLTREEIILVMKSFESANHRKEVVEEAQRIINIFDAL